MFDKLQIFALEHFNFMFAQVDPACNKTFFGIPPWYKYLTTKSGATDDCAPVLTGINDLWLVGLAAIEILLRVAIFVAMGFVLYAGIKYSASRGNSDKVNQAKFSLQDALIGLIIAVIAASAVSFLGERLTQ